VRVKVLHEEGTFIVVRATWLFGLLRFVYYADGNPGYYGCWRTYPGGWEPFPCLELAHWYRDRDRDGPARVRAVLGR
jgi:hypothetical protein